MSEQYEETALLALPAIKEGSHESVGVLSWNRPYLINQVRNRGVDVFVSRGSDAIDAVENTADIVRPHYDNEGSVEIKHLGKRSLDSFGVVRSIIKQADTHTTTPFLNPNSIRQLGRDKHRMASEVLVPSDVYKRAIVHIEAHTPASDMSALIGSLPGEQVVAKPTAGMRSRGVIVGTKAEVIAALQGADVSYIVEEKLNFSAALPDLKASSDEEQTRLDYANQAGVNKELRMYYFGDNVWDSVGRVAKAGERDFRGDKWLYVDLDSIPGTLIDKGNEVIASMRKLVEKRDQEFNIALDWVYASTESNPDPDWQVMEVNATEPQLVHLSQNDEVGRRQYNKLATQISRIALS